MCQSCNYDVPERRCKVIKSGVVNFKCICDNRPENYINSLLDQDINLDLDRIMNSYKEVEDKCSLLKLVSDINEKITESDELSEDEHQAIKDEIIKHVSKEDLVNLHFGNEFGITPEDLKDTESSCVIVDDGRLHYHHGTGNNLYNIITRMSGYQTGYYPLCIDSHVTSGQFGGHNWLMSVAEPSYGITEYIMITVCNETIYMLGYRYMCIIGCVGYDGHHLRVYKDKCIYNVEDIYEYNQNRECNECNEGDVVA